VRLGRDPGSYSYQAISGSLAPATITATATASPVGPPTQLVPLAPLPSSFKVGVAATQKFSAQLADAKGSYVRKAGVALNASMSVNGGQPSTVTAVSNAEGVITLTLPPFDKPGSVLITLTVPDIGLTVSGTFPIN